MANKASDTTSNDKSNRKSTINGMALSQAKQMAERIFGQHLFMVEHNTEKDTFDIWIYSTADKRDIDKFKGDEDYRIFYAPEKPIN